MGDPISRSSYEGGYQPSPIVRPERTFADGRWTVILTRELSHPVQRVWAALTEPAQLQQWAPFVSDRNLTETGVVAVTMLGGDDRDRGESGSEASVESPGRVLESDPPWLLVFEWGADVLRWELTSAEAGTVLVLRHTLNEAGMDSGVAAGWHLCLDVADALMKDMPFGPVVGTRAKAYGWADLNQRYAEIFKVQPSFT